MFSFYLIITQLLICYTGIFLNNMLHKKGPRVFVVTSKVVSHGREQDRCTIPYYCSPLASEGYFLYMFIPVDGSAMYLSTSVFMAS